MGGAIAESTTDNDFFYLCPECDYDLGEDFSNMTEDSCPECDHSIEKSSLTRGSANTAIQLQGFDDEHFDDDEMPDIEDEGQEIRIEGYTSGTETYNSFCLPYGYQWSDVESWSMSGETVFIEFTSGLSWTARLSVLDNDSECTGDYRALDDRYNVVGEY